MKLSGSRLAGLYWRQHGPLRYFTTLRVRRWGLGKIDRRKLAELTKGEAA